MKMGTTRSPDFALRLRAAVFPISQGGPVTPSIAALTIDPEINVMGQGAVISKVIRSSRLRAGAPLTVSEPDSFRRITRHYTARG